MFASLQKNVTFILFGEYGWKIKRLSSSDPNSYERTVLSKVHHLLRLYAFAAALTIELILTWMLSDHLVGRNFV